MDPFSLTVGVLSILQVVKSCLKLARKHVGPSTLTSAEQESVMKSMYEFHGAMRNLQTHLELNEDDDSEMASLAHLRPVVQRSFEAAQLIKEYLQSSGTVVRALRGSKFDKNLKASLKALDDASKLFQIVVLADEQTIMLGVKKYVQEMSEGIRDIQSLQLNVEQQNLYRDIRAWLGAHTDVEMNSQRHEHNLRTRHPGTCEWLLTHTGFRNWIETNEQDIKRTLWLKGSPGQGKSFVCSRAIGYVTQLQEICLHYFYRFDDQTGGEPTGAGSPASGVRAAALLVDQLFRHFWRQDGFSANPIASYIETAEKNIKTIAEVVHLIIKAGLRNLEGQGEDSNPTRTTIYLFLDGLDEDRNPDAVDEILRLFRNLEDEFSVIAKIWISSRDTNVLKELLDPCPVINFDEHAKADVKEYLMKVIPKFDGGAEGDAKIDGKQVGDWVLEKLEKKATSNFLYARLMVKQLSDGVYNIDDIRVFITSEVPDNLAEMYRRIFRDYQGDQHKYISLLFSLIASARRPLRLYELREAMTLAFSDPSKGLDPLKTPMRLQRLFAPLIEMQEDPNHQDNPLCRLCHSTVDEFLTSNPDVLRLEASGHVPFIYSISPSRVGDLCLRYLSQERYSGFLQLTRDNHHGFLASGRDETQQHILLSYCAKYWDRHLDDLKPTPQLFTTICDFLNSANFQTLLQVQSLFVRYQFSQFRKATRTAKKVFPALHRRVFPSWFGGLAHISDEHFADCKKYRSDYRHFFYEWGYLLELGHCVSSDVEHICSTEHFRGEVDRCLSGLLGPSNFLNHMKERYPSFMMTQKFSSNQKAEDFVIAEGLSFSKRQFNVILSPLRNNSEISFQTWDLNLSQYPEIISTINLPTGGIDFRSDATQTISFSNDASSFELRNGTFGPHDADNQILLGKPGTGPNFEVISTDFDRSGDIMVAASRNVHKKARINKLQRESSASKKRLESSQNPESDSSESENEDQSDDEDSSNSEDENSAEETCSEGSTDISSDDEEISEEDLDSDDNYYESGEDLDAEDNAKDTLRSSFVSNYQQPADNKVKLEEDLLGPKDERPTYPGMPGRFRDPKDRINASIAVYDISSGRAVRLFHYDHLIPAMLYHSPPVLHPFKPLVVWPLGGGDVLFADYVEKTYFIRGSMPTTRDTRHICMKTQFSPCGRYLHIANLEGRVPKKQKKNKNIVPKFVPAMQEKDGLKAENNIMLSVFVNTHQLSEHKTTRSPPHCIHKTKINLGQFAGLSLAKLPITFTWAPDHLYLSISGTRLNVFRVRLFKPDPTMEPVVIPRLSVMLPLSATCRQVYFLPPKDGDHRSMVLIGSYNGHSRVQLKPVSARAIKLRMGDITDRDLLPYPCPPVGFHINEEDFGGWVPASDDLVVDSGERFRDGKLIRKMEFFNWENDVDLEGICNFCNTPLFVNKASG